MGGRPNFAGEEIKWLVLRLINGQIDCSLAKKTMKALDSLLH